MVSMDDKTLANASRTFTYTMMSQENAGAVDLRRASEASLYVPPQTAYLPSPYAPRTVVNAQRASAHLTEAQLCDGTLSEH